VSAAQNIVNLYTTRDPQEPQWWVEQAFVITAAICLVLELFHRAEADGQAQEYQVCVKKAIKFLQLFYTSSVAVHGVRLLMSLLQEYEKLRKGSSEDITSSVDTTATRTCSCISNNIADIPILEADRATQPLPVDLEIPLSFDDPSWNFDIDRLGFEDLMDYLPSEGSLNTNVFHASMLSANGWSMW
jgi:transcription elongation factor SPT5